MTMQKTFFQKAFAVVVLGLLTITVAPVASFAETAILNVNDVKTTIMPRMTYIEECKNSLNISNGIATVDCWVSGDVLDATKAKVIAELQLKSGNSWIAYGTWTNTENSFKASVYETKNVTTGHTYRVKATYTIWEGSQSETTTVFGDEMTA